MNGTVSLEQRIALLAGVPALAGLTAPVMGDLAAVLTERHVAADSVVVTEGTVDDRLYLLVEGRADVAVAGPAGRIAVTILESGASFGETALLWPGHQRQATVTALTPLRVLSVSAPAFEQLLARYLQDHALFIERAAPVIVARFLTLASPFASLFATLPADRLQTLATCLVPVRVPAGATVLRQGEHSDTCYLLCGGRVEVLLQGDTDAVRRLATVGAGALLGEIALLTESPRIATIRTLEPCTLLVLQRADLLELFDADERVRTYLLDLLQLRQRLQQVPGILAHRRATSTSETLITLKDPRRGAYYRLSPQGWFLWQRLDGQHTVRDLTLEYAQAHGSVAPQAIVRLLTDLVAAGFVVGPRVRPDLTRHVQRMGPWTQVVRLTRHALIWRVALRGVDEPLTQVYRRSVHFLYTRWGQGSLAVLAGVGFLSFVLSVVLDAAGRPTVHHQAHGGGALLLLVIPAYLLSILIHEAGHACTTKAFGYTVHSVRLGWYWFTPVAYVDTSDLWLAERWPRIAVSLAGPYANAVLGGLAALVAGFVPGAAGGVLWQVAVVNYLLVFVNLNPLLEYDGYYVLVDLLERPNLRQRTLAWLGHEAPDVLRRPAALWQHRVEVLYGLGSILYVVAMALLTMLVYRVALQEWVTRFMPSVVAAGLVWVAAGALVLLSAITIVGDIGGVRPR